MRNCQCERIKILSSKERGFGCCEILDVDTGIRRTSTSRECPHICSRTSIRRTSTSVHLIFMLSLLYLPRAIIGLYGNREPRMHGQDEGQCMRRFSEGRMKREREGMVESFMMVLSVFGLSKNDRCDRMVTG